MDAGNGPMRRVCAHRLHAISGVSISESLQMEQRMPVASHFQRFDKRLNRDHAVSMFHLRLGSIAGFPVALRPGFFLLLALAGFGVIGRGGIWSVGAVIVLFICILAHELGHAFVARRRGVPIGGIDLGFFGGAAKMMSSPKSANDEIAIAAAGPAVSVLISGAGFAAAKALGVGTAGSIAHAIGWMNLIIAAFNMLPALPMDGGRILRAVLSRWSSYIEATDRAVLVSRVFAIGFVVAGFMYSFNLVLLAPLLWMWGSKERLLARMLGGQYVRDKKGYRLRNFDEVEVLAREQGPFRTAAGGAVPPGYQTAAQTGMDPFELFRAFAQHRRGNISVRRQNGRIVIEVDPN
jgi:Zn-dependent protease